MKAIIRQVLKKIFNALPHRLKEGLIRGNFRPRVFKALLNEGTEVIVTLRNEYLSDISFQLNKTYPIERDILVNGCYDPVTLSMLKRLLKNEDVCIDVGANVGSLTFGMANAVKPNGKVYAIEPGPEIAARLKKNQQLNPRFDQVISHFAVGFSNQNETKYWQEIFSRGNAAFNDHEGIAMELTTMDKFVTDIGMQKLDFIKIDVEGMELEVIEGALNILQQFKPMVYYESWVGRLPEWDRKQEKLSALFEKENFVLLNFEESTSCFEKTSFPKLSQNTLAVHMSKLKEVNERMALQPDHEFPS